MEPEISLLIACHWSLSWAR